MKTAIAIAAALFTLPIAAKAEPVTWNFFETGITCDNPRLCSLPPQPYILASLTLPGPTSSGSANWINGGFPVPPPTLAGDGFVLAIDPGTSSVPKYRLSSTDPTNACFGSLLTICRLEPITGYNISWSETAGILNNITVQFGSQVDDINLGLFGGIIASDGSIDGCSLQQCAVTGFWRSNLAVAAAPEPASGLMLAGGLLAFSLWRRRTRCG